MPFVRRNNDGYIDYITRTHLTMFGTAIIGNTIYFLKIKDYLKSMLISIIAGWATLLCSVLLNGNAECIMAGYMVLGLVALYFDRRILFWYGISYEVCAVILLIVAPDKLCGYHLQLSHVYLWFAVSNMLWFVLLIALGKANKLTKAAEEASHTASSYKDTILRQTEVVQEIVGRLHTSVGVSAEEVHGLSTEAGVIVDTVERYAATQEEASKSLETLRKTIISSNDDISQNYHLASSVKEEYSNVMNSLKEVMEERENFQLSMGAISETIRESVESANVFATESEKISGILNEINEISGQTNLSWYWKYEGFSAPDGCRCLLATIFLTHLCAYRPCFFRGIFML